MSASPEETFAHPHWRRAEEEILASLAERDLVLLIGDAGTGKSILLRSLHETLRAHGHRVRLLRSGDAVAGVPEGEVLLIDEADRLSTEQIGCLRLLPNPLLLAGLPALRDRVAQSVGLAGSVVLDPLSADDVARFVASRLVGCGRSAGLFTPEAVLALARHSGGLFRLVVLLAGAALFFAELRAASTVTAADVEEAVAMRTSIAEEAQAEIAASVAPQPAVPQPATIESLRWPRRALAAMAGLAFAGLVCHLVSAAHMAASTPAATGTSSALNDAVAPTPPAAILSPKHSRAALSSGA